MTREEYVCYHLGKHVQANTYLQHHMLIIHLLQEVWQLREDIKEMKEKAERCCEEEDTDGNVYERWANIAQEKLFNFNLERMKQAVEGETISIPVGLTREERREWIRDRLEEMEDKE